MAHNLFIQKSFPELLTGCCHDKLFAVVFNQQGQALQNVDGFWALTSYVASDHTFAIPLIEDAERTQSFSALIAEADFTLLDTPDGEFYEVEFWKQNTGTPGTFNRSLSTLLSTERFVWYSSRRLDVSASLGVAQRSSSDRYVVQMSIAYNADTSVIQMTGWLEDNDQLVTDTTNCNAIMVDSQGNVLFNSSRNTPVSGQPGLFQWNIPNIAPSADISYFLIMTVTDVDAVNHTTVHTAVAWD